MQPASAKWYDRRDSVFIEFCVEDSKDVRIKFDKSKIDFCCVGGTDNAKHLNQLDLFDAIDPNESKHKRTDRSVLCCLRKTEAGKSWPRLTKDKAKFNWLSVDFNNWKDWADDSEEDMSSFDKFSDMMNNMGGDDLPDLDGVDEHEPTDSDDESAAIVHETLMKTLEPLKQSSEPVKELYTQLTEKLEAQKKSPPEPDEAPSLDLGLHPVTVPTKASTPTTPL